MSSVEAEWPEISHSKALPLEVCDPANQLDGNNRVRVLVLDLTYQGRGSSLASSASWESPEDGIINLY